MAHIFFIDPLEKLNITKDSTLMMALSFQKSGFNTYLLFEKDFFVTNQKNNFLELYCFEGEFKEDGCYLESLELLEGKRVEVLKDDIIHMRIDPPYDSRYQRYLWMLDFLQGQTGCTVLNSPLKIMKYNEKLVAYRNLSYSHLSYIGSSQRGFEKFIQDLKGHEDGYDEIILKPLDLYSGIGVEKISLSSSNTKEKFNQKVQDFGGAIICQPFIKDVYNGEYRSIYFDGVELGTIIKTPKPGEFLANIAQGGKFEKIELPRKLKLTCDEIAKELYEDGVRMLAFDLLGEGVNEVNITCPGLLVEVSYAHEKNLCFEITKKF